MAHRNLYQYKDFFRIQVGGVWYPVNEPVGWNNVKIKGKRDDDYYGLNYEFVDPKVQLLFPNNEGGDRLKAVYDQFRGDGISLFQYGYSQPGQDDVIPFTGNFNFNEYHEDDEGVTCTIERVSFQQKLRTRIDTPITLSSRTSLDNEYIIPCAPLEIRLHSKKIKKFGRATNTPEYKGESNFVSIPVRTTWYIQPDTTMVDKSEVEEMQSMPAAVVPFAPPNHDLRYQFRAEEEGELFVKWDMDYYFQIKPAKQADGGSNIANGNLRRWQLVPFIHIYDKDNIMKYSEEFPTAKVEGDERNASLTVHHVFSVKAQMNLEKDDKVYMNVYFIYSGTETGLQNTGRQARVLEMVNSIEFTAETLTPTSMCTVYRLFDALNYMIESATGAKDVLRSNYFGPTGCQYKRGITNGYQLRRFNLTEKPVIWTIKGMLELLDAVWGISVLYTFEGSKEVIQVERMSAVWGEDRVLDFDEIFEYTEDHSKRFTWNEFDIGYNKFAEGDENQNANVPNTLDEHNTYIKGLLPIQTYKNKYTKKTDVITSGYSIENMRREQFKKNPSSSLGGDDEIYMICYLNSDERVYRSVNWKIEPVDGDPSRAYVTFLNKDIDLSPNDQFSLGNVSQGYQVVEKVPFVSNKYKVVSFSFIYGAGRSDVQIPTLVPVAERNENFEVVQNIIAPETAYNLAVAPIFMLFNHSMILNTCLYAKPTTDTIICTFPKNNGEIILKYVDNYLCRALDVNREIQQKGNITLFDFNRDNEKFMPTECSFKTSCSYEDLITLRASMLGIEVRGKNFSRISHPDWDGNRWESHVLSFEYEPSIELLTVYCIKVKKL